MKEKKLTIPYSFKERRPHLEDKVLYVPPYYFEHEKFETPSLSSIFENENPISIEFCSGHGDWIVDLAKKDPNRNWIAVEKQFERARKIFSKREKADLKNLLIVCGEAHTFIKYYLKENVVENIFVNFPDPWPKGRHAKHRLIHTDFLDEISRIVKKGGSATFVTDDPTYAENMISLTSSHDKWSSFYKEPYFITEMPDYGYSYFRDLWMSKGKTIHYMNFVNQKELTLC